MKTVFLILLLVCGISSALPISDTKKDAPKPNGAQSVKAKHGTEKNPFFVQKRDTTEDKSTGDEEIRDRKSALEASWYSFIASAGGLNIAKEAATAAEDAANAAWKTVYVGIVVAVLAGVQIVFFWWQLGLMTKSNDTASKAAQAALNQSDSIMHAERAYVKIGHVKPGLKKVSEQTSEVRVKVRNMGRTPAEVTDVHIDFCFLESGTPLPKPYPFRPEVRESLPNGLLMPNEWLSHHRPVKTSEALANEKQLWFFGEVDYIDVFGRRWRGGYARKYWDHKDDNLYSNTEARDNFDRERIPGEGNDWTPEAIDKYNEKHNPQPKQWYWRWPFRSWWVHK